MYDVCNIGQQNKGEKEARSPGGGGGGGGYMRCFQLNIKKGKRILIFSSSILDVR